MKQHNITVQCKMVTWYHVA